MSVDTKSRSVLSELKKPLIQPAPTPVPDALEQRLLGVATAARPQTVVEPPPPPSPAAAAPVQDFAPPVAEPPSARRSKLPTVPVTFHLPVRLRDRIKVTAQAQQRTMLEIAVEALEGYLERHPVSEQDVRRLLGL